LRAREAHSLRSGDISAGAGKDRGEGRGGRCREAGRQGNHLARVYSERNPFFLLPFRAGCPILLSCPPCSDTRNGVAVRPCRAVIAMKARRKNTYPPLLERSKRERERERERISQGTPRNNSLRVIIAMMIARSIAASDAETDTFRSIEAYFIPRFLSPRRRVATLSLFTTPRLTSAAVSVRYRRREWIKRRN